MNSASATSTPRETSLERAISHGPTATVTALDALRAARQAWLANGRIDMGALAAELGVSRATLYRWVGDRERLLGEVLWSFAEPTIEEARAAPGSGPDHIAEVVERYLRAAMAFEPVRRFIELDPEFALRVLASKHSQMQRRSIAAIRDLLGEQTSSGALDPPLELDALAYVIVRICESFLYNDVITGGEPDVDQAVDAVRALLHAPPVASRAKT